MNTINDMICYRLSFGSQYLVFVFQECIQDCILFCVIVTANAGDADAFADALLICLLVECIVVSPRDHADRLINDSETLTNSWFVPHCDSAVFIALSTSTDLYGSYHITASINHMQQSS